MTTASPRWSVTWPVFVAGPFTLLLRHGDTTRTVTVTGAPACHPVTHIDLLGSLNARTGAQAVSITAAHCRLTQSDYDRRR